MEAISESEHPCHVTADLSQGGAKAPEDEGKVPKI